MTETFGPWGGIDAFDVRVVDPETGEDVAPGEEGEYWVRGYALTVGLYKRERDETFTPDGFYRTGDLGSFEHGQVYFRARMSDMIKTKGANVAPAEVEEVLKSFPEIRVAVVAGLPHDEYGQEVAVAVVPEEGNTIDVDEISARAAHADLPLQGADGAHDPGRERRAVPPELQGRPPLHRGHAAHVPRRGAGRGGREPRSMTSDWLNAYLDRPSPSRVVRAVAARRG